MKPRKEIVDKAQKDGAIDKAALLLSLSYITMSVGNNIIDEANDYLAPYGLNIGELKKAHNTFMKAADIYFRTFSDAFSELASPINYFEDLDNLQAKVKEWSGIEEKFKEMSHEKEGN